MQKKCKLNQNSFTNLKLVPKNFPDECKIQALKSGKGQDNITEVKSLIGFFSYYRRFVKDFAGIAKPLHDLRFQIS